MGKMKLKPKYNVFTFRADDSIAELIHQAAASYPDLSSFLLEAAATKAVNETYSETVCEPAGGAA